MSPPIRLISPRMGTGLDPSHPARGFGRRDVQQFGYCEREESVLDRVAPRNPQTHRLSSPNEVPASLLVHRGLAGAILRTRTRTEADDQDVMTDAGGPF